MTLKWITNIYDPAKLSVEDYIHRNPYGDLPKNKILGDPKGTDIYSVDELKKQGFVGVYVEVEE